MTMPFPNLFLYAFFKKMIWRRFKLLCIGKGAVENEWAHYLGTWMGTAVMTSSAVFQSDIDLINMSNHSNWSELAYTLFISYRNTICNIWTLLILIWLQAKGLKLNHFILQLSRSKSVKIFNVVTNLQVTFLFWKLIKNETLKVLQLCSSIPNCLHIPSNVLEMDNSLSNWGINCRETDTVRRHCNTSGWSCKMYHWPEPN